ncbi:putative ribonuclease H-like domain-containing protein [Tanacetum coccineum]
MNDLEEEYQAIALLVKSKRLFKKGTQRFNSAKATDQTECYKYGKKGHFARDCWSKTLIPSYQSHFQPKLLHSSEYKPESRHTKVFEAKYNKVKVKLSLLNSSASALSSSCGKNKGIIAETYDWDEEEMPFDTMNSGPKDLVFVKSSANNSKVSITGNNKPKLSKAEDSTLSNHDTGKVPSNESQRNKTDHSVVVSDSSATDYDLANESLVCIIINEPSSTPARGNKSFSASKINSAPAGKLNNVKMKDDPPLAINKPRNPQHVTKNYETCGTNVHTTSDHNDIEWFRKREALQAKKVESFKASKTESSSALRSKTPTKRFMLMILFLGLPAQRLNNLKEAFQSSKKDMSNICYERPDLNDKAVNESQYKGMIGSLMNLTTSRPGIQFSTGLYARHQANIWNLTLLLLREFSVDATVGKYIVKDLILKDEYDIWAMEMEHYLEYIDNDVWKVIQNGNSKKRISTGKDGVIRVLPPVSAAEIHDVEKERKARTILLMSIPKEHLRRFHGMDDAKEIWEAIRNSLEGLEKGYDRFQQLLSQLEAHGAEVSNEDANHKFLRALPSAWSNLAMTMRAKPEIDTLSIDDFKSSTNKVKYGLTGTFSTCNPSTSSNIPEREAPAGFADEVIYSLFAKQSEDLDLLHENLEQIDDKTGRRVRIDGKAPVGFDKKKLECYKCHNTGHFARECTSKGTNDGKKKTYSVYQDQESGKQEKNQISLLTMDDGVVNWGDHTVKEETNHALMAISSNSEVSLCSKTCINSYNNLKTPCDEQTNQLANEIYAKDEKLKRYKRIGMKAVKEKEQLQKKRFSKTDNFKGVPHPLTRDYTPKPQEEIDDSLYVYVKDLLQNPFEHSSESESESISVPNEMSKSKSVTTNEIVMSESKEVEPSCVTHVKTSRQQMKNQETLKINRNNWNEMMERELGEGYSFTKKKCFVCGSLSHLIKDCDYHEKKMAREAELKKQRVFITGNGVEKPVWTNANRVNHANQFVPRTVQLNAGRPNINSVRPNINTDRTNVNSVRPNINTGRTNVNSVRPRVNTGSSNVNTVRSRQPVPTQEPNSLLLKDLREIRDLLLRPQQVIIGGTQTPIVTDHPQKNIIDRATSDESKLWHRRLGHINFKNLNKLVKGNLVRGLPSKIENQLSHRVKIIRSDNGTEFKNRDMLEFCGNKGIKQEYSNARTPQQNGVAERMNRTLIEAARTMLADSLLPTTFWAEAVRFRSILEKKLNQRKSFHKFKERRDIDRTQPEKKAPSTATSEDNPKTSTFRISWKNCSKAFRKNEEGVKLDFNSLPIEIKVSPTPTLRIHNIHPKSQILGDPKSAVQTRSKLQQKSGAHALFSFIQKQQRNNHKDQQHCLFPVFYLNWNLKIFSEALQETVGSKPLQEDCTHLILLTSMVLVIYLTNEGIDLHPKKVYKVVKALYGLHQAPRAWYATLSTFLEKHGYKRGLQVKQNKAGIFISQDKYVAEILKKFDLVNVKTAITPMETKVALTKDEEALLM